jgi:hypothetical protein
MTRDFDTITEFALDTNDEGEGADINFFVDLLCVSF